MSEMEIKAIRDRYRKQARKGTYDDLPDFKALCLSRQGFSPSEALVALGHENNPKSRSLQLAIKELSSDWSEPTDDGDDTSGQRVTFVCLHPWAASGEYYKEWCEYFQAIGWTPPEREDRDRYWRERSLRLYGRLPLEKPLWER